MKLLDNGIIYPIPDSPWVSPIYCVPKKGAITVVTNENYEPVPTGTITGWRILLMQDFDIEIKDIKGTENVAVDHLSRLENDETSDDSEVDDNFPGETLMEINTINEPWIKADTEKTQFGWQEIVYSGHDIPQADPEPGT
ncbi:hypothetical protein Tco_1079392 [Tanacetum coccineum]|uniref:Reverse transcriptase domain-containing protein n=1 Tax=Tanacetum coccineum TaxID=301880 RepID=A0ABQ5HT75_9ASTR